MPCDVPAHAFDHIPEVQAVHLADRYILVLSAGQVVGRNAATQALYGWGWADESHDDLGEAIYQAGMQSRFHGITIYRRTDGVMVAASNAGQRWKLMTYADRVETEVHSGETWHYHAGLPCAQHSCTGLSSDPLLHLWTGTSD